MKSIVYRATGDASVLALEERDPIAPAPGEVRVRVAVSGVNPTDWKSRAGGSMKGYADVVPNQDGAGVVDEVGEGVTTLAPGDRVWIYFGQHERPYGTAQEYITLPAQRAVPLPEGMGFDVGAALGIPAMTAHRALTVHEFGPTRLTPGSLADRIVLVAGGAGAVGHAAIQLARWAGARVITTVSTDEKAELARAAGADVVLRYTAPDIVEQIQAAAPEGVDIIVEVSPRVNADLDIAVIANHGVIAYYANDGGDTFSLPVLASFAKNVRVQGLLVYTVGDEAMDAAARDITAALHDGALPVGASHGLPITWFELEQTGAAHDAVEAGTVGKVLIRVADL